MSLYETDDEIYCYPGTTVLRNLQGLTSQRALTRFETAITAQRFEEPLPDGRLSVRHFRAVHHHLFQDVYAWAGKSRTVRISKEGSAFCYPEHIDSQLKQVFGALKKKQFLRKLSADEFAEQAAAFLSHLNAIHAFVTAMAVRSSLLWRCWLSRPGIPCIWGVSIPNVFCKP